MNLKEVKSLHSKTRYEIISEAVFLGIATHGSITNTEVRDELKRILPNISWRTEDINKVINKILTKFPSQLEYGLVNGLMKIRKNSYISINQFISDLELLPLSDHLKDINIYKNNFNNEGETVYFSGPVFHKYQFDIKGLRLISNNPKDIIEAVYEINHSKLHYSETDKKFIEVHKMHNAHLLNWLKKEIRELDDLDSLDNITRSFEYEEIKNRTPLPF